MRKFRRLFFTLVILAVLCVAGAHWFVKTGMGTSRVVRRIELETGYNASISSARLTLGMNLVVSDLRLWFKSSSGATNTLLEVPEAVLNGCRRAKHVRLVRPVFTGVRSDLGNWIPSDAYEMAKGDPLDVALSGLARRTDATFDVVDGSIVLREDGGNALQTYSGLDWARSRAVVKGRPGMKYNAVSLQVVDGEPVEFKGEWLSDGDAVIPLSGGENMVSTRRLKLGDGGDLAAVAESDAEDKAEVKAAVQAPAEDAPVAEQAKVEAGPEAGKAPEATIEKAEATDVGGEAENAPEAVVEAVEANAAASEDIKE